MGNEKEIEVKVDTTAQGELVKGEAKDLVVNAEAKTLERPTSIEPHKGAIEPLRPTTPLLEGEHIHFVHIVVFVVALVFLFGSMWKFGKKTKF